MKKALFPISETSTKIIFKNDYFQITLSKENGNVVELINLMTGDSILDKSEEFAFASLSFSKEEIVYPSSLSLEDGRLKFVFKDICDLLIKVDAYSNYIALTLDSEIPDTVMSASFGILKADYFWELDNENAFGLSGIAMTTTVDPENYPGGSFKATKASVYTAIGVPATGSKFGIAFSRMTEHRNHLKSIVDDIDPAKGITSKHGGPYALDHKDIYSDYVVLQRGLTPETADENVELCKRYSVEQIDMHQGPKTFIQGDFNFRCAATEEEIENNVYVPASVFKERIADKVTPQGIQLSLHTYSSLISKSAYYVITEPKWQQQIVYCDNTFSVKGELSADATDIFTYEDASTIVLTDDALPYRNCHTKYILIDEEIIFIDAGSTTGFFNVERGQFGTKAVPHKDGAEIRHLYGWYGMFQSKPLSELFYHLAEETAKAYNDGGYEMIYLDGLESCIRDESFCKPEARYYVTAEFIRTVVSNCKVDPLIEYSILFPCLWSARGRGGAVDISNRGHKIQKAKHFNTLEKFPKYFYTGTVGWFGYAPDRLSRYKNTITETMFRDDLDYMGSLAIAHNFGTVCNPFSIAEISGGTLLADNFDYYGIYSRLREADYFAPEVKKQILANEHELKVFQQEDGSWAFKEMEYFKHRIFDLNEKNFTKGQANNPFKEQKPFVRVEPFYSSYGENPIVVQKFDETKPITEQVGVYPIPKTDYVDNFAFKIRVLGNGSETDKITLTLKAVWPNAMEIPLNFTGWKDIIIIEPNNDTDALCRLTGIISVELSVEGDCEGVRIGDLMSVKIVDSPVVNPSVSIGDNTITFNTEIHSGEFIEYYPETDKAYHTYYIYEFDEDGKYIRDTAHVKEISYTGSITVPAGSFSYVYGAQPIEQAPVRAKVVIGVSGNVIKNPDNWIAPDVDIPDECMKFKFD